MSSPHSLLSAVNLTDAEVRKLETAGMKVENSVVLPIGVYLVRNETTNAPMMADEVANALLQ